MGGGRGQEAGTGEFWFLEAERALLDGAGGQGAMGTDLVSLFCLWLVISSLD